jgi:hypothetical protein
MTNSNEHSEADRIENWASDSKTSADLVDRAFKEAVRQAIEEHHRAGNPVPIARDRQIVLWYPDGSLHPADDEDA